METDNSIKLGKLSITILIISVLVIIFSFFAPIIFTQESKNGIVFSNTGEIGDTLSGIMNPFIAISGVLLTFLAFYIQFKANKLQRELFRLELNEQKEQFRKTQFENQFYEMLRLHKGNVSEIRINNSTKGYDITGRQVFDWITKEFELCYYIAKKCFPSSDVKTLVNEAYGVLFHGLHDENLKESPYFKILNIIKIAHSKHNYSELPRIAELKAGIIFKLNLDYPLFIGYSTQLAHYYRHLFQTVKFIVYQDSTILSYEEKRKYLRILRAQLSNPEQTMIFYNWFSNFGKQWEDRNNKFFTDYRMIHNIYQALIIPAAIPLKKSLVEN